MYGTFTTTTTTTAGSALAVTGAVTAGWSVLLAVTVVSAGLALLAFVPRLPGRTRRHTTTRRPLP